MSLSFKVEEVCCFMIQSIRSVTIDDALLEKLRAIDKDCFHVRK